MREYKSYVQAVNETDRSENYGAVGKAPLCYRWVEWLVEENAKILDFGSGKGRTGERLLRPEGYVNVDSYDIGENDTPDHVTHPERGTYDCVILSNVLNVQHRPSQVFDVIDEALDYLKPSGIIIWNFPKSPNKTGMTVEQVRKMFEVFLPKTGVLQECVYVSRGSTWEFVEHMLVSLRR